MDRKEGQYSTFWADEQYQNSDEGTQSFDADSLLRDSIISSPFAPSAKSTPHTSETPSAPDSDCSDGSNDQAKIFPRRFEPSGSKKRARNEAEVQVDSDAPLGHSDLKGVKVVQVRRDDLPLHWLPITAETGKDGRRKAKSNYTRRRWDRIVKSRQEAIGRGAPCKNELVGMIKQLQGELGTKAEPLVVVEISTTVQNVGVLSEDEEVQEAGGRLYRCTQVTGEDGKLTNSAVFLLTKYVQTKHNFKEFIHPLDDVFVRDAKAKSANFLQQHPHLRARVIEFQKMVYTFRRDVADGNHFNEILETCLIETINKLWNELKKQVVPTTAATPVLPTVRTGTEPYCSTARKLERKR